MVVIVTVVTVVFIVTFFSKNNLTTRQQCDVFRAAFCNLAMFLIKIFLWPKLEVPGRTGKGKTKNKIWFFTDWVFMTTSNFLTCLGITIYGRFHQGRKINPFELEWFCFAVKPLNWWIKCQTFWNLLCVSLVELG